MSDTRKLLTLADACSDALLGGERGWERMDFNEFVSMCRKALGSNNKAILQERERCANICKSNTVIASDDVDDYSRGWKNSAEKIDKAIREG